jgi:hypothetical protein
MGVVSSAVAAMDAHRGVAAVAENGVLLLRNLSFADANRVCARWCSMDSGQGGWPVCVGWGRDRRVCGWLTGLSLLRNLSEADANSVCVVVVKYGCGCAERVVGVWMSCR